jgi:CRP-like cAMP-binding protein
MPRRNALIASIEPELWSQYEERFSPVEYSGGKELHRPGEPVQHVQFPTTAVLVLGVETLAGESVNVALLGPEGAVGVFEACGSGQIYHRAAVQFGGVVWQASAATYRTLYMASASLRTSVHKYMETLMVEALQSVACNALHGVENRLARTLLDACEKSGSSKLPITQVALAHLLGVQRTTVAAAVSSLQRAGCIKTERGGGLEVIDHPRLEAAACSCRDSLAYARRDIQSRTSVPCEA